MLFNSIGFLLFFPIVITFYYITPFKYRWIVLLISSYYFYMSWEPGYILIMLFCTIINYILAILIDKTNDAFVKKFFLTLSIISSLSILFFFKYYNFFVDTFEPFFKQININLGLPSFEYLLPVGISFYIFQTLSYTIDVYRKKTIPDSHFGIFALYVSFFPALVAGPIERSTNLLPQFYKKHAFNYDNITNGLKLMLWGLLLKVVIADRLAILVNEVYNNPTLYTGLTIVLATVFFAYQIFCDFAGYSFIAIGAAQVMGIKLMDNFNRPYFSKSIKEFWSRWHISLSTWFRDYLYIPLGGNRVPKWRWQLNLFTVFLVSGLWHGANMTYVIWGALHGFYQVFGILTQGMRDKFSNLVGLNRVPFFHNILKLTITFSLVTFAWIFFRANSLNDAFLLINNMFTGLLNSSSWNSLSETLLNLGLDKVNLIIAFSSIIVMELIHVFQGQDSITQFVSKKPILVRWTVYCVSVLCIIFLGVFENAQFIYFQF